MITQDSALYKTDTIGVNKSEMFRQASAVRAVITAQNTEACMNYIFGRSDENPYESVTEGVNARLAEYETTIEGLMETTETSNKRKINR